MKRNKLYVAILISLVLSILLTSCSSGVPFDDTEVETKSEEEAVSLTQDEVHNNYADAVATLPDFDFNGREFRIATDDSGFVLSSANASFVGKEQYLRNLAVEEKYNVKITLTDESGLPTITERIKAEALAGTDFCDLIILRAEQFRVLASNDLLVNVYSVPYLDLKGGGVYSDSVTATTLGSFAYGFSGDFIFEPADLFGVFVNKTVLERTNLPNIYDLVRENQWDFENFLLYAEEAFAVSRAMGVSIAGFSSTENRESLINILWAAGGLRFIQNEYSERPALAFDNETTDQFITSAQKLLFESIVYSDNTDLAVHRFNSNESLFLIAPLSTAREISSAGTRWGLVPLPKLDINQPNYYSYINGGSHFAGFVNSTTDLNFSGIITDALTKASVGLNKNVAKTEYLNLYFHSAEDAEMMQRIMDTPYFDAVEFFTSWDDSIKASTQTLVYRTVSSEGNFDVLYAQYTKMFEKFINELF